MKCEVKVKMKVKRSECDVMCYEIMSWHIMSSEVKCSKGQHSNAKSIKYLGAFKRSLTQGNTRPPHAIDNEHCIGIEDTECLIKTKETGDQY